MDISFFLTGELLTQVLLVERRPTTAAKCPEEGNKLPYFVELAQLQYKSGLEILKLTFYEENNPKSFLYGWGSPGTKNIGINLRWLQAGLTKVEIQPYFLGAMRN